MLFQCAAAQLPAATVWEFQITDVRSHGGLDGVQLAEVYLYDADGNKLTVVSESNPGGNQSLNPAQTADKAVDGDETNRWLDRSILTPDNQCCGEATLQLTLAEAATVSEYRFVAAKNAPKRDPISWRFGYRDAADRFVLLSEVVGTTAPGSSESYAAFPAFTPPSPPTIPAVAGAATVWEFVFTDVRSHAGIEGVQLAELYLKDASGNNLTVVSASNPGGDQSLNKDQTADKAVDGDLSNRWLDASIIKPDGTCCGESTLQLTLAEAAAVSSYQVRHFIKTT